MAAPEGSPTQKKLHMDFEIFGFFVNFTKDFAKISLDFNPSIHTYVMINN